MRKKDTPLFGQGVPPSCEYCDYNTSPSGPPVCRLGLKLSEEGKCRRYRYDPISREPGNLPPLPEHDPEEFKL